MIDAQLVTRKMVLILEDLKALEEMARRTPEEHLASASHRVMAERYLERMIGRMIDINYHLVTASDRPPPRDYFSSFVELATIGILPSAFAHEIAACAGLRNRLVHEYDEIDPARVFEGVQMAARDVPVYLRAIEEFIGTRS